MDYKIAYTGFCVKSDARNKNEDNFCVQNQCLPVEHVDFHMKKKRYLDLKTPWVAVFDGMGGEAFGEEASFCAAKSFARNTQKNSKIQELVCQMDQDVAQRAYEKNKKKMGTTVVAIRFGAKNIRGFNVGDSRCYRFSNKKLTQLSMDHTVSTPYLKKTFLWQAVGMKEEDEKLSASKFQEPYEEGDIYLLCTDGLTNVLSDRKIQKILANSKTDLQGKVEELEKRVRMAGEVDNITVLLMEVEHGKLA